MGKLAGKVAVITGGSSGMALETAKLFVAEGAYVFITGRRQEVLDEAVKAIGRNVTGVRADSANLADRKIRVNSMSPGVIDSGASAAIPKEARDFFVSQVPLARLGVTKDIAAAVLYLASDDSSYTTAIDLVVDGGLAHV